MLAIINIAVTKTGAHVSFRIITKELLKRMPNYPKSIYFSIFLPDFLQHDLLFCIRPINSSPIMKSYF